MNRPVKITALVGSYRKGGVIDATVDAILASAREQGAEVSKINLIDREIEFCRNCRTCTQAGGKQRGECPIVDDMNSILDEIERSDAIVLASPTNCGSVTAVMQRFRERLVCFAHWPWGAGIPKLRNPLKNKRAVVVASSAAPALIARLLTPVVKLLKQSADTLGARTGAVLFVGLAARQSRQKPGAQTIRKARRLGVKLASREFSQFF